MKTIKHLVISLFLLIPVAASASNFSEGMRYYSGKNYSKAKEAFLKEVLNNSSNGTAYYFLGEIEKNAGNFTDAENYYRKAVAGQLQKKYVSLAYWNIVVLVDQRGNVGDLIKICREFWHKTGDGSAKRKIDDLMNKLQWSDNDEAIAIYKDAMRLKESGKTEEARKRFAEALSIDPTFLAPHFEIGLIFYSAGKENDAAQHLKIIADKVPWHGEVNLLLGDIYYNNRSYESAKTALLNAVEYGFLDKNTQSDTYTKLAGCFYNTRDYDKAAEYAGKSLALKNSDRDTLMLLSAINIKREKYKEALESLTKLSKLTPDDPDIIFQIGSIHYKQGNTDKCMQSFTSLYTATLKDGKTPEKYQKAMLILFSYEYDNKAYEKAASVGDSIEESQRDFKTNLMLGKCYAQIKKYDRAIQILERLSLSNDDKLYLAKIYVKSGNTLKAKPLLSSLIRYNPPYKEKALADKDLRPLANEIIEASKPKPAEKVEKPKPESVKSAPKNTESKAETTAEPQTRGDDKSAVPAKPTDTKIKQATENKPAQ